MCPVRATELAQQLGTIRVASIILLGALVKKLGLEQYDWTALIRRKVSWNHPFFRRNRGLPRAFKRSITRPSGK